MSTEAAFLPPAPGILTQLLTSEPSGAPVYHDEEPNQAVVQRNPALSEASVPVAISVNTDEAHPDKIDSVLQESQVKALSKEMINLKDGGIIIPLKAYCGKVSALVLTYNRKEVLARCLNAILTQEEPPDEVIVLDNGSTDGTCEYLKESGLLEDVRIILFRLPTNIGPAGGVDVLFRLFEERGSDWLWFLDDDTIAEADTLKELKGVYVANFSRPEEIGFLKSVVVSADGSPNGLPEADLRASLGYSPSWADRLRSGLLKVRWSTFNSIFIPRSTLVQIGNIRPHFYFAGEDIDFTFRVTDVLPGYLVGRSKVTHLCAESGRFSSLLEKNPQRISMGTYFYRNNLYFRYNYYSFGRTVLYAGKCLYEAVLGLGSKTYPLRRSAAILGGLLSGLIFVARHRKGGEWTSSSSSSDERSRALQLSGGPPPLGGVLPQLMEDDSGGCLSDSPTGTRFRGRGKRWQLTCRNQQSR